MHNSYMHMRSAEWARMHAVNEYAESTFLMLVQGKTEEVLVKKYDSWCLAMEYIDIHYLADKVQCVDGF